METTRLPKLLIDLYKTGNLNSGIGRFSYNFAEALAKSEISGFNIDYLCPGNFPAGNWGPINLQRATFLKRYFPQFNSPFDLWHSLYQFPSFLPNRHTRWILTIHDLNFLVEKDARKSAFYLEKLQRNIDRATAVTVISDYTGIQVRQHLKLRDKPLFRIYNGISVNTFPEAQKPGFLANDHFFFSIGIISAKKNFHVLVPLLRKFPGYDLVIAGENNSPYAESIRQQVKNLDLAGRVHLPGKISDRDRYWLYSHCRAFLFPSLAEGFGMPVIEAMLLGKPVFASALASLPEIGGQYAFYWDNFNPDHMAEVMQNGLKKWEKEESANSSAMKTYATKFSWNKCISDYLSMYQTVSTL